MRVFSLLFFLLLYSYPLYSAQFIVNDTRDLPDLDLDDGACLSIFRTCTLRAAISEANHQRGLDKIILDAKEYMIQIPGVNDNSNRGGDFDVLDDLIIEGNGISQTIINANFRDRVFELARFARIFSIKNLTIKNGKTLASGAGIYSPNTKLNIYKVKFINNISKNNGGGIYSESFTNIEKSSFISNQAIRGGGIYSRNFKINSSEFRENIAHQGGGLYQNSFFNQEVSLITNSVFENNQVVDRDGFSSGGGIFADKIRIASSLFRNNTSIGFRSSGGGIALQDLGELEIINSVITNNSSALYGGGISAGLARVVVEDSDISYNQSLHGGGLNVMGSDHLDISQSRIEYNQGGGIYIRQREGECHISDSIIRGNSGENGAGLYAHIWNFGNSFSISNTTISENTSSEFGGGVYVHAETGSEINISNSNIETNHSVLDGGGIYFILENLSAVNIDRLQVKDNLSDQNGGGLFFRNYLMPNFPRDFLDNPAAKVKISDTNIENNQALDNGGGIYNSLIFGGNEERNIYPTLEILNSSIIRNTADNGGGIFNYTLNFFEYNFLVLMNSTISSNLAYHIGGGIYANELMVMHSSTVVNNKVFADEEVDGQRGAGLFIESKNIPGLAPDEFAFLETGFSLTRNIIHHNQSLERNLERIDDNCFSMNNPGFISGGYNFVARDVVEPDGCLRDRERRATDNFWIDPLVEPLEETNHQTYYHPLNFLSRAIDAIPEDICLFGDGLFMPQIIQQNRGTDQNHLDRPQGDGCEPGSFEKRIF